MSGAEAALLGVGILCNAMQIITFAKDSLHVYRNIRDGRSPDPNLDLYLKNAKVAFDEMNQSATQMGPLNKTQQQIVDVGKCVHDCVDELQQKFAKLHVDSASKRGVRGKVSVLRKSVATLWHGKELEDAEKNLERHERLLRGLVLDHLCSQSQAAEIITLQSFQGLEGGFQRIISQLVDGSAKVSDLTTELLSNTDRLVEEHATTRIVIKGQVTSEGSRIRLSISQSISQFREELLRREQDKAFEKQRKKQHEQLLSSLRFPEMNSRKNQIKSNFTGTFNWIFGYHPSLSRFDPFEDGSPLFDDTWGFDSYGSNSDKSKSHECDYNCFANAINLPAFDSFPSWLKSDANLFWVSGKPASGKSALMKFLAFNQRTVYHLNNWHSNVRILTHFFWKPGQPLQRNVQGMALSLLHQVLDDEPDLSPKLWETKHFIRHKRYPSDWSLDELSEALLLALEISTKGFCIFLDGLDEAKDLDHLPWPNWTDSQVIHRLLEVKNLKLCASSREEHAFCSFFERASRLRIHQLNSHDIIHFVHERLEICGEQRRDRDQLVARIVKRAEGVFLWVILVVDRLNRAIHQNYTTIKMLEERLEQTPSDLTKLYVDMWGRIGDDAQLPSIQAMASRYFNFVIVARRMNGDRWTTHQESASMGNCMSSLLVMATATGDMSMESMLSKGRVITAEELLASCAKLENELRHVCHGLLEVVSPLQESDGVTWTGDHRLCDSNSKKVDFIHRSAFDFLMDTVDGLKCLQVCGLSESDHVSRLLAAHLIRSRFVCVKLSLDFRLMEIWHPGWYRASCTNLYLRMAIVVVFDDRLAIEMSFRNGLLNIVKDWQLSGLYGGHVQWTIPKCLRHSTNSLELEFIETGILAAYQSSHCKSSSSFLSGTSGDDAIINAKALLNEYPAAQLLNAIPVVLRALSSIDTDRLGMRYPSELLKYFLHRLHYMTSEEEESLGARRNGICALHSWYIVYCLKRLCSLRRLPNTARLPDMDLLCQLGDTLLPEDGWHHGIIFELQTCRRIRMRLNGIPLPPVNTHFHYALVVGSFATVYRLLDKLMLGRLTRDFNIEIPEASIPHFEPILIADTLGGRTVEYHIPDMKFFNQIEDQLFARLLNTTILERRPVRFKRSGNLNPIDSSQVFNYVIDEVKKRRVAFIHITDIIGLGDALERE